MRYFDSGVLLKLYLREPNSSQAVALGLQVSDPAGPHGPFHTIRSPLSFDGERATSVVAPPTLGQHNDEVLPPPKA